MRSSFLTVAWNQARANISLNLQYARHDLLQTLYPHPQCLQVNYSRYRYQYLQWYNYCTVHVCQWSSSADLARRVFLWNPLPGEFHDDDLISPRVVLSTKERESSHQCSSDTLRLRANGKAKTPSSVAAPSSFYWLDLYHVPKIPGRGIVVFNRERLIMQVNHV